MSKAVLPVIEKVTAGVDWVTCTLPEGADGYQEWIGKGHTLIEALGAEGNVIEYRKLQGYEGVAVGNSFVGTNEERAMAQFSGERANDAYYVLNHDKLHVSRIDLQLTVQTEAMDINEGKRCLRDAKHYNKDLSRYQRRRIDFWLGDEGADTLYVGAPSSERRLRIYNKEAQSEDIRYTRCWRYECVYRNDYATRLFFHLVSAYAEVTQFIVSQVAEFCRERGITIRNLEHIVAVPLERIVKVPTDVERKLKWLEHQVKPTLRKLSEMGYGDQAAEAMGLWIPKES